MDPFICCWFFQCGYCSFCFAYFAGCCALFQLIELHYFCFVVTSKQNKSHKNTGFRVRSRSILEFSALFESVRIRQKRPVNEPYTINPKLTDYATHPKSRILLAKYWNRQLSTYSSLGKHEEVSMMLDSEFWVGRANQNPIFLTPTIN